MSGSTSCALPITLAATLGLILLPYGSVTIGAQASAEVLVAMLFFGVAIWTAIRSAGATPSIILASLSPAKVLALPALLISQLIVCWTVGLGVGPTVGLERSFAMITATVAFFVLVHYAAQRREGTTPLLLGLVVLTALQAGYSVVNLLSGNETVLFAKRIDYHQAATGSLVSKNHFAYLMEMLLPVCLGYLASIRTAMVSDPRPNDPRGAQSAIVGVIAALAATALLLSASRMGIFAIVAAAALVFLVVPRSTDLRKNRSRIGFAFAGMAALVALYAAAIGLGPALARAGLVLSDFRDGRLPIWEKTWEMFTVRPILGHGWGTFADIYPAFKAAPTGLYSPHAHNEYLQIAAESGIIGIAVVTFLVGSFALSIRSKITASDATPDRPLKIGFAIAIVSALIHSGADFGLRVPGVGFTFAYIAALYCANGHIESTHRLAHGSSARGRRRRSFRYRPQTV